MSLPRYPKYKDSGVEWLGDVPEHWEAIKLARHLRLAPCYGVLVPDFEPDGIPMLRIKDMESGNADRASLNTISRSLSAQYSRTIVEEGDVVLSVVGTIGEAFRVDSALAGVNLSRAVARLQLQSTLTAEFLCWIFQSLQFRRYVDLVCVGTAQRVLNMADLSAFRIANPGTEEQVAIATFLDRETAKIDALVAEQRRLIELLKEKRQAVISHAVTKGLNPDARMKPSGIEWLGDVPEHWRVSSVRRACQVDNTLRYPIDMQTRTDIAGDFPYYGPTGILSWINEYRVDGEYFLIGEDGDHFLKFDRQPMTIHVTGRFNVNNHAHLVRGVGDCSTRWACLFFSHKDLLPWLIKQGVGRYKLRKETLVTIPILVPPPTEQDQVLDYVEQVNAKSKFLIQEAERAIELLQERRTALISAAVTGKIDVRGLAETEAA
jgi:type I restriction enzyme S subunit